MCSTRAAKTRQRGFGLIEVLIALVVFSIGLLGLVNLQTTGLKTATSAAQRGEALILARNVVEAMRQNRTAALTGAYATNYGPVAGLTGKARTDLEQWKAAIATRLPDGDGRVVQLGKLVTVTVRWAESWDPDTDDGFSEVHVRTRL